MPDNDLMRCRFVERLYGCGMSLMFMVGVERLELSRDYSQQILSLVRLPIPPHSLVLPVRIELTLGKL
jgi:hypothetical protein